jgi:hypothetical protein
MIHSEVLHHIYPEGLGETSEEQPVSQCSIWDWRWALPEHVATVSTWTYFLCTMHLSLTSHILKILKVQEKNYFNICMVFGAFDLFDFISANMHLFIYRM